MRPTRALLFLALLTLSACAPAAKTSPAMQERQPALGAALFTARCGACHQLGSMGTLLLARRKDGLSPLLEARNLEPDQIKEIVRSGSRNMPALTRGELSDQDLHTIAIFLSSQKH